MVEQVVEASLLCDVGDLQQVWLCERLEIVLEFV